MVVKDAPPALQETVASLNGAGEVRVRLIDKDPLTSEDLESMNTFSYNHVIILPQKPRLDAEPERIDSETIVVLLHLRKQLKALVEAGAKVETKLITEILDSANRDPVFHAGVDDFIISNRMVSMLSQMSEEPEIEGVYENLPGGGVGDLRQARLALFRLSPRHLPLRRPDAGRPEAGRGDRDRLQAQTARVRLLRQLRRQDQPRPRRTSRLPWTGRTAWCSSPRMIADQFETMFTTKGRFSHRTPPHANLHFRFTIFARS